MNFFQSVFSVDPEPSNPESDSDPEPQIHENLPENPSPTIPSITSAWTFGSTLMKTLASKSESVIETYRRDLEEFSSGIKKETAVIREAAAKAVKELPTSFEAGAGLAQESLESVGQAIDDLGTTVTEIIAQGKESILTVEHSYNDINDINDINNRTDANISNISNKSSKPYSRLDAQIRTVQSDMNTYLKDPEDVIEYNEWKLGFQFEAKLGEIDEIINEKDGVVREIYREIVPSRVDESLFWVRYFFRVYKIKTAEEARVRFVKRAISGKEDEELSWDVDEDDYEENVESDLKGEQGKVLEEKDDKRNEADLKTVSVVSSQPSPKEDGWDEIGDVGSSDESKDKVVSHGSHGSTDRAELKKRLSVAEEEEDLTWDIEDDDD